MENRPAQLEMHPAKDFYMKNSKVFNTLLMVIIVFVGGELIIGLKTGTWGTFLSVTQVFITIRLASFIMLFGLCQQLVICVGNAGLDLSVGYIATLAGIITGHIMNSSNSGIPLAIIAAICVGAFFGLANGFFTSYLNLPSLVVTMAMANIVQGIVNAYTKSVPIDGYGSPAIQWLSAGFIGPIPCILIVIVAAVIIMTIIFNKTRTGIKLLGIGANETTAYLSGVSVKKVRMMAFMVSGIVAGLTGVLLVGSLGRASMDMGSNYVMPSIVAVVVGGVAISGGEGNYLSVCLGAIVLQSLTNLFVALGWGDAGKWLGYGAILIIMLTAYIRGKRVR